MQVLSAVVSHCNADVVRINNILITFDMAVCARTYARIHSQFSFRLSLQTVFFHPPGLPVPAKTAKKDREATMV